MTSPRPNARSLIFCLNLLPRCKGRTVLVDPVCGKQVREYTAEAATFFEGRIYYFCSGEHKAEFLTHPEDYSNQVSMGKVKFGVMGAASGDLPLDIRNRAYELGAAVARKCMVMVTGAAPMTPNFTLPMETWLE